MQGGQGEAGCSGGAPWWGSLPAGSRQGEEERRPAWAVLGGARCTPSPHPASPMAPSVPPRPWPGDEPELVPFLPLIWVAWADGALSGGELGRIRDAMTGDRHLSPASVELLERWLDPQAPPTPSELEGLRERIREVGARVPPSERTSLARLGAALARAEGEEAGHWSTRQGMEALAAIEELLGVLGGESARALLEGETPAAHTLPPRAVPPPSFDVHRMRRHLDGPWGSLRERVFRLLAEPAIQADPSHPPGHEPTDVHRERTFRGLQRIAEEGLGRMAYPVRHGGEGEVAGSIVVFETLGYGDLSLLVKYGVQFGLFGGSVYQLGTEPHHARWLPAIGSLELPGCYAMTEVDHGSNVRDLETVARFLPEADAFEIHTPHPGARKEWIGNAALHGQMATVFAQLHVGEEEHGVHAFLVPIRGADGSPVSGVEIEDSGPKVGLNGVDNGRITLDRVQVPRSHLLDRFGRVTAEGRYESPIPSAGRRFFTMLGTLVTGRISIAAASGSAARTALAIAIPYSEARRQFGPSGAPEVPVLDYLTQQRLLLPRLAESYALHFANRELIRSYALSQGANRGGAEGKGTQATEAGERARLEVAAAGLKAYASRHAVETIQACREACGGRGYHAENRFGALRADTDIFTTFEGANVVLLQLVAKGLLSRYREEMGDLNLRRMVRVLAERAGTEATRRNPVRSRRTSEEHLLDPGTHMEAFRFREARLLHTVARRLKSRIDAGMDSFEAMNACQDHLVTLARAHVETELLERFHEGAAEAPETGGLRESLTALSALWALWRLEADRAWFLEAGWMEPGQTRAIRTLVNELCRRIRPDAQALVDSFGIPPEVLRAPAARGAGVEAARD
jgi:acyl-CoA oxidase